MRGCVWVGLLAGAAAMMPVAAMAQSAPTTEAVTLTFNGVVDPNIANSVQILQPNGSYTPYTGTFPGNFPYQPNQPVSISIQANVPTPAYLEQAYAAAGQVPANGIYAFGLTGGNIYNFGGPYTIYPLNSEPTISGGLHAYNAQTERNLGLAVPVDGPGTTLSMVYNANTGQYSLSGNANNQAINIPGLVGAGLTYDPSSATLTSCTGQVVAENNCAAIVAGQPVSSYSLSSAGNADGSTLSSIYSSIYDTLGDIVGKFTLTFDGSWNAAADGPTDVPEPGMVGLFAMATGALAWRRRRARAIG